MPTQIYATEEAMYYGNRAALISCWQTLKERVRREIVIDMALKSLHTWQSIPNNLRACNNWRVTLLSDKLPLSQSYHYVKYFNVPSCYSEMMRFFLSQMDEGQQLTFFKTAYELKMDSVLLCFLDWPHKDDFLPTINRLWGIIPQDKYGQCLLDFASKYSGGDREENRYYDYQSLLWALWEETPEDYKRYLFLDKKPKNYLVINEGKVLLPRLLERSPFQEKDEVLFKRVFCYLPQEERRAMMCSLVGKNICLILTQKINSSFVNWLLEESFPKEEIPRFKKQFLESDCGVSLCLYALQQNREKLLEDLLDWCLELDTEKTQFKCKLLGENGCLDLCGSLLRAGAFRNVEGIINFCLSSDEMKNGYKVRFAKYTCGGLLNKCSWELLDQILSWSVDTEEKIRDLKKDLFCTYGIDTHYTLVFIKRRWGEVERFYTWFGLSPEGIEKLKEDTIFAPDVVHYIYRGLYDYTNILIAPLLWCLTGEEMVFSLQKKVEEKYFNQVLDKKTKTAKELLNFLVRDARKLFYRFRKEFQGQTSRGESFARMVTSFRRMVTRGMLAETGSKRSSAVTGDESSSRRKKYKQCI